MFRLRHIESHSAITAQMTTAGVTFHLVAISIRSAASPGLKRVVSVVLRAHGFRIPLRLSMQSI